MSNNITGITLTYFDGIIPVGMDAGSVTIKTTLAFAGAVDKYGFGYTFDGNYVTISFGSANGETEQVIDFYNSSGIKTDTYVLKRIEMYERSDRKVLRNFCDIGNTVPALNIYYGAAFWVKDDIEHVWTYSLDGGTTVSTPECRAVMTYGGFNWKLIDIQVRSFDNSLRLYNGYSHTDYKVYGYQYTKEQIDDITWVDAVGTNVTASNVLNFRQTEPSECYVSAVLDIPGYSNVQIPSFEVDVFDVYDTNYGSLYDYNKLEYVTVKRNGVNCVGVRLYGCKLTQDEYHPAVIFKSGTQIYRVWGHALPSVHKDGYIIPDGDLRQRVDETTYWGYIPINTKVDLTVDYLFPSSRTAYGIEYNHTNCHLSSEFPIEPVLKSYEQFLGGYRLTWELDTSIEGDLTDAPLSFIVKPYLEPGTYTNDNVSAEVFKKEYMSTSIEYFPTDIRASFPDEIEEDVESEFTVIYPSGRTLTFLNVPENVYMSYNTYDDGEMERMVGTLMVYGDYEEDTVTLQITDGVTTIDKIIKVIEKIMPTITINKYANLSFPKEGGVRSITITYTNTADNRINKPFSTVFGVTLTETNREITESGTIAIGYDVTVPATTYERDIPLVFSCSSTDGSSTTETFTGMQDGDELPDSGAYINLDRTLYQFPAKGGSYTVRADFGYPGSTTLSVKCMNYNGVYPISWCKASLLGGHIDDDGYEGHEDWEITMTGSEIDEPFAALVIFSYTNYYGESASTVFTAIRDAGNTEPETFEPEVQPYVSQLKLNVKGINDIQQSVDYINVMYQDFDTGTIDTPVVNANWFRIVDVEEQERNADGILMRYYWEADENTDTKARQTSIKFSGTVSGIEYHADVLVQQAKNEADEPDEDEPNIPSIEGVYVGQIWKDVEFNFGGAQTVSYTIYYGDELIFSGKAWKRPGEVSNKILVNKICQDYLAQTFLDLNSVAWEVNTKDFTLRNGDGTQVYHTYRFVNDWSYSEDFSTGLLSHPILNKQRAVRGQMFPFSLFGAGEQVKVEYGVSYKDGYTDKFGNPIEDWWSTEYITKGVSTDFFIVAYRDAAHINSVWIGDDTYQLEEACAIPYVMYYLNPWGGFDWFPILGKVSMKDSLTQYTYQKNFNNTSIGFGKMRYLSEINKGYQLNTGWLKQEESDRMWYLLQSNVVYLHDIKANKIMPVIITDTETEHKQRTRAHKLINYTFNVELSQVRTRM